MLNKPLTEIAIADEMVMAKIYIIRDQKVMLDKDLAKLYGVETKRLKEQVRRNLDYLRSQFATSSWGGSRYLPMAFTDMKWIFKIFSNISKN